MQAAGRRIQRRVCASTSNLGPGFDCLGLGLALDLAVEAVFDDGVAEPCIASRAGFATAWPDAAEDLLLGAFTRASRELGRSARGARFDVHSDIPVGRGLGSSGAAIVAGLTLAQARWNVELPRERQLELALELEGHPDNVTASLLGGLTLGVPTSGRELIATQLELHPALGFAVAWPDQPLSTKTARAVLPPTVRFQDAVEKARRLALLLEGLRRGERAWIEAGSQDRLHVEARLPLIPGAAAALAAARAAGAWMATLSGAGSGLFAICAVADAPAVAAAMGARFHAAGAGGPGSAARAVEASRTGPRPG